MSGLRRRDGDLAPDRGTFVRGLFREAALEKAAHPFSKEQIPGVFRLPVAITAAILAVVITSFCVWCGVGSIAENVHGS